MSVLDQLASVQGIRGTEPNKILARKIAEVNDAGAVKELVDNLANKNRNIQSDCIKTLYEAAEINPKLIAPYVKAFGTLLKHKNNRLVWGAMTALDAIAGEQKAAVYAMLPDIMDIAEKGTVITKDHAVGILIKLSADEKYASDTLPLLLDQLKHAANNQFAMYAENSLPVIAAQDKKTFIDILSSRINELEKDSQKKRIEKLLKKLSR